MSSATTADMRKLDIRHLKRAGMLVAGTERNWSWWLEDGTPLLTATLTVGRDRVLISHAHCAMPDGQARYLIEIERTTCHMGGHRVWWRCPVQGCGRRVALLYGSRHAIFACRNCYGLGYQCQRESRIDREFRRIEKLRERLGWEPGIAYGTQGKPPRMHWKTYWRLLQKYMQLEQVVLHSTITRFEMSR